MRNGWIALPPHRRFRRFDFASAWVWEGPGPASGQQAPLDCCHVEIEAALAPGKTQEEKDVLNKYQKLSRYDSQKKELVGLWAADKSCKWYSTWEKKITTAEAEKANERRGFGTR
eukprot:s1694_g1.t2